MRLIHISKFVTFCSISLRRFEKFYSFFVENGYLTDAKDPVSNRYGDMDFLIIGQTDITADTETVAVAH